MNSGMICHQGELHADAIHIQGPRGHSMMEGGNSMMNKSRENLGSSFFSIGNMTCAPLHSIIAEASLVIGSI